MMGHSRKARALRFVATGVVALSIMNVFAGWVSMDDLASLGRQAKEAVTPYETRAVAQYTPTGGTLVTGTQTPIVANATTGNAGSWRGTLASDNRRWVASSTASGVEQHLSFDGAQLNNANKMIVVMEAAATNTTLQRFYQICDWTSGTQVNNAADAQCTGGGWRNLNIRDVAITLATETSYTWHIYDGYWNKTSPANEALATPLSNFIRNTDGRVLLRAYAANSCTICTHTIDYARVDAVIDPVYSPSGLTTSTASTVTNDYGNTVNALFTGQTATDNQYVQVAGTASVTSDFYLSFDDVRTYPGANAILVRAEYSCTATGINHRPKIWNFTTGSWEDLTSTSIACSTTDATQAFAKGNVDLDDYVSGGEIRIGWRGLANGTQGIRLDMIYVMVGSVNADSSRCEISFGTGTASNCANTRTLDTTAALSTWQQTSEAESATFGHDYYGQDNDADAAIDHASSANLWLPVSLQNPARITGLAYAMYWRSNATTMTTQGQFKDLSGANVTVSGGWSPFGTTNAATTYTYQDSVVNGYFLSNPDDYIDTEAGELNVRIRTTVSTAAAGVTRDIDFVFASVQWIESTPSRHTLKVNNPPTGGHLQVGTQDVISSNAASTNVGSWKGTLAADNIYWRASSTTSGVDQQVQVDNVKLNNANKLIVAMEAAATNTTLQRFYQICDWSSSTEVENAADANCTGGGWRTLNTNKTAFTSATETAFVWHVYNGYWRQASPTTSPLSTPLTNFVRGSDGRVLVRAFSTTSCTTCVHRIDRVSVQSVIDPIYFPAGLVTSTTSTVTGTYKEAISGLFTSPSGADNVRVQVAGTASTPADFYFPMNNVRTYSSMNAIVVAAEYSCSATGISHRPKIWNFTTGLWEDLTTASIACSTSEAVGRWAKSNVDVNDYVSGGQIRIGWRGLANGTQGIRLDYVYAMLGSVNDDSARCEISFGTGTASNCVNTRTLDTNSALSTWQQTSEAESANFGHDFYAQDNDSDAATDHASSANLDIPASIPADAQLVGRVYAMNWRSNATTMTTQGQFKDFSGLNATVSGGWTAFGTTNLATTYTYQDAVTNGYFASNADDYVDTFDGYINVRIRTTVSTAAAAITRDIDFVFSSVQWAEPAGTVPALTLTLGSSSAPLGSLTSGVPAFATTTMSVLAENLTNGYQIQVNRASSTATMTHTDATTTIPDFTAWDSSGSGNANSTPAQTLSFRVSTSTANYDATWWGSGTPLFGGIPLVAETVMNCTGCVNGTTDTSVSYRVDVAPTQKSGAYAGVITYTALSNP